MRTRSEFRRALEARGCLDDYDILRKAGYSHKRALEALGLDDMDRQRGQEETWSDR